ncbi:MAG: PEP-CTERM sorting domain-containing protein [Akkermansia sp.]|nr:PEP-CTERM sorting domain-containing protein [Akkermansia sp.]
MKHSLFTNTVILLLGCHAGVWADASFSFYNTWELYDDDNGEFIGMTISEDYRTSSSLTFQLTDAPEGGYQVDIAIDGVGGGNDIEVDGAEGEFPAWLELTSFTLMSCNAEPDTELWGVVTDRDGSIVASALTTATGIGEAVFDFSESAPVLQAATSYTLYFVIGEREITIGSPFNASSSTPLGIAWTTDGWEEENEDGTKTWVNSFPESNELKYNDEGNSDVNNAGNAPAVYITATGYPAPEPTTSALSLLALAGFALRRRRS